MKTSTRAGAQAGQEKGAVQAEQVRTEAETEIRPEIEATFIHVDKEALREKLRSLDAELLQPEILMKRTVFDVDEHSFVRVRDEGDRITMSYKHLDSRTLSGMKEVCLEVNDYDDGIAFVKACGLRQKAVQEALREEWLLDGVKVDIDTWPWLPTYVEIEGPSEELVTEVTEKLGFDMGEAIYGSVDEIYRIYYDVTTHDINYCPEIKFTEAPAWLEEKRREKPLQ